MSDYDADGREVNDGGDDLLDASLGLAQTQLLGQLADETSIDGRAMGVLAFSGALLAADVAAKDTLGRWWVDAPGRRCPGHAVLLGPRPGHRSRLSRRNRPRPGRPSLL